MRYMNNKVNIFDNRTLKAKACCDRSDVNLRIPKHETRNPKQKSAQKIITKINIFSRNKQIKLHKNNNYNKGNSSTKSKAFLVLRISQETIVVIAISISFASISQSSSDWKFG